MKVVEHIKNPFSLLFRPDFISNSEKSNAMLATKETKKECGFSSFSWLLLSPCSCSSLLLLPMPLSSSVRNHHHHPCHHDCINELTFYFSKGLGMVRRVRKTFEEKIWKQFLATPVALHFTPSHNHCVVVSNLPDSYQLSLNNCSSSSSNSSSSSSSRFKTHGQTFEPIDHTQIYLGVIKTQAGKPM